MFPIGDENHGARGIPIVTWLLIGINTLVFLYQSTLPLEQLQRFIIEYGVIPAEIQYGHDWYTLLTSMFIHGSVAHIVSNMLFLWIFGDNIEQRFGRLLYLLFYLVCGFAASVAHVVMNSGSLIPSVGASGAISGVMGAYILLYPLNRVQVLVWWYGIMYVPALLFLGIWFLLQLFNGLLSLGALTAQSSGVAFWAHVGGFVAGLVLSALLSPLRPERIERPPTDDLTWYEGPPDRWW